MNLKELREQMKSYFDSLKLNSKDSKVKIEYAPFDLFQPNKKAKIVFVGLTPGRHQKDQSEKVFINCLKNGDELSKFETDFRKAVPFEGSMRTNLVNMLDQVGMQEYLGLNSVDELFENNASLAEMTSLLKMPVFKLDGKNYSGTPKPLKKENLKRLIEAYFLKDLEMLAKDVIIVPLGKTVFATLEELGVCDKYRVLPNFPHPSGANGHRLRVFNENKRAYREFVRNKLKLLSNRII